MDPLLELTEGALIGVVQWLKLGVEATGAAVIAIGVVVAVTQLLRAAARRRWPIDFSAVRFTLARYLALALEFQLGADILGTAVAPSWDKILQLGAIAVIRTALNYFLMLEMREYEGGRWERKAALGVNDHESRR